MKTGQRWRGRVRLKRLEIPAGQASAYIVVWEAQITENGAWRKDRTFPTIEQAQNWARDQVFRARWRAMIEHGFAG